MVAVPATASNGGPVTNHAALGSHMEMQLVSLAGPAQGSLSFWESGNMQPAITLAVGETAGTGRLVLTQNEGQPGCDPYGAIPGRHLAANRSGLYCLGFRIVDTSTNGPAGGPLHADSPLYFMYFQAGVTISQLTCQGTTAKAWFGGEPGKSFYLERCSSLGPTLLWETVAGPLTGASNLQSLTDPAIPNGLGLFRLRVTTP
jgi:hypothetical protein